MPRTGLPVRRDNPKYLHLILAVTFLYQMQRPVKHDADAGDYIETTLDDIAIANELATDLFGQSLGELSRPGPRVAAAGVRLRDQPGRPAESGTPKPSRSAAANCARRSNGASISCGRTWTNWRNWNICCRWRDARASLFVTGCLWDGQGEGGERFLPGLKSVEQLRQEAGQHWPGSGEQLRGQKSELRGGPTPLRGRKSELRGHFVERFPRSETATAGR